MRGCAMNDMNNWGAAWRLQDDGWELLAPNRQCIPLSASERLLLIALADQPGRVVSREVLSQALANIHPQAGQREYQVARVNMIVSRIRAKARQTGDELPLKSVSSRGYMLQCPPAAKSP